MNPPLNFDLGWINSVRVNRSAAEARVKDLSGRRTFKQGSQAKAYLHAIACLDLTTLRGDDTFGRIARLCAKALQPVTRELLEAVCKKFELPVFALRVGAVCVYPTMVREAAGLLKNKVPVASVATGFPAGQTFPEVKVQEVDCAIQAGADEIDIVIDREMVLAGQWGQLYKRVKLFSEVCHASDVKLKTILEISDLATLENIARASLAAMMAGSDFIKTSTGFGDHGATLEAGLVMARQIREFYERTGQRVGFKAAGGFKEAKNAMSWLILMKEELGDDWTYPELFRIGASSLLTDIEMQLDHLVSGAYSEPDRMPKG